MKKTTTNPNTNVTLPPMLTTTVSQMIETQAQTPPVPSPERKTLTETCLKMMPLDEYVEAKRRQSCGLCWRSPLSLRANVVQIVVKFTSTFTRRAGADCYRGTALSERSHGESRTKKLTSRGFHPCMSKHVEEWMTGNTRGNVRAAFCFPHVATVLKRVDSALMI